MSKLTSICGLFLLYACGTGSHPSALTEDTFPNDPIPDELAQKAIGHYAMLIDYASSQKLPIVGDINTLGRVYKIADIQRDGEGLKILEKSCRLEFKGGAKLGLTISDATIQATPVLEARFAVKQETPDAPLSFTREMKTQVFGANLEDPVLDPLPSALDDPLLVDLDGDGNPGITGGIRAYVLTGDAYYVLRSMNRYEGTGDGAGVFRGLVKARTDGVILDVSNEYLRPAIGRFEFIPDSDPNKSKVILVRIADSVDCLTARWATYNPEAQPMSTL